MEPPLIAALAIAIAVVALLGAGLAILMARQGDPAVASLASRVAALERPSAASPEIAASPRDLSRLEQRVSHLERRLVADAAQPSIVRPPASDTSPGAAPSIELARGDGPGLSPLTLTKAAPAGDAGPASEQGAGDRPAQADVQWIQRLLADYARMVDEGGAAVDTFLERYAPTGAIADPGGSDFVVGDDPETAMLWAISAEPRLSVLLPGSRALNNWSAHFAPSRKSTAQEHLGAAFELTPDTPRFAVRSAAWLTGDEGQRRLTLARKGRLEGFLS